jgi:mannosyl-glycoprotein endo-beta-N-acetylglucosaminidase
MPILGGLEPPRFQPLYFKSLLELDKWVPGQAGNRYDGVLKFKPRKSNSNLENRGKLLVISVIHYLKDF